MRIGELSRVSGVPVPTIKYYLREGLLPAGAASAPNQASYGDAHLRRLRLIRALIDVGGVSVAAARDVIAALGEGLPPHFLLGAAHHAVMPQRRPDRDTGSWREARREAAAFVAARGWMVDPDAPALDLLADAISALRDLAVTELLDNLGRYAAAAQEIAAFEVGSVVARQEPESRVELVVLGTVLGETVLSALRLLAHEHESGARLTAAGTASAAGTVSG